MSTGPQVPLAGAVDLSALARPPAASSSGSAYVFDVTEATFQRDVVERSAQVPVVIDFWAAWCGPCRQLSPVLERLAEAAGGAWVLAKIDTDANQRVAAAFGIQSIPSVFAVVAGQPVPLFQGALPEAQVRAVLDEVLRVARERGVAGGEGAEQPLAAEPGGPDPRYAEAEEAVRRRDVDGALAAFRRILDADPGDAYAALAVARLELTKRTAGVDEAQVRRRAAADPDDVDAALAVADLDLLADRVDEAVDRLVGLVRRSAGAQRERARLHLLGLFEAVEPDDPRLAAGRRALASALF